MVTSGFPSVHVRCQAAASDSARPEFRASALNYGFVGGGDGKNRPFTQYRLGLGEMQENYSRPALIFASMAMVLSRASCWSARTLGAALVMTSETFSRANTGVRP